MVMAQHTSSFTAWRASSVYCAVPDKNLPTPRRSTLMKGRTRSTTSCWPPSAERRWRRCGRRGSAALQQWPAAKPASAPQEVLAAAARRRRRPLQGTRRSRTCWLATAWTCGGAGASEHHRRRALCAAGPPLRTRMRLTPRAGPAEAPRRAPEAGREGNAAWGLGAGVGGAVQQAGQGRLVQEEGAGEGHTEAVRAVVDVVGSARLILMAKHLLGQ